MADRGTVRRAGDDQLAPPVLGADVEALEGRPGVEAEEGAELRVEAPAPDAVVDVHLCDDAVPHLEGVYEEGSHPCAPVLFGNSPPSL
ncbi:hypothetical protein D3C87_1577060 [compost metagenome]